MPPVSIDIEVRPGLYTGWPGRTGDAPLLASPGWLRAMAGRLGPRPVTLIVREAGAVAAVSYGSVQERARPGEFFDLYHVLVSTALALPLTPPARASRARLAATAPPPDRWVPNLTVMLPGYECHVLGPGRHAPHVLGALVDGAVEWATGAGLGTVAFLYTTPDEPELAATLTDRGFTRIPLSLTWDLHLPGSHPTDYLAMLPRRRRVEVRRERRLLRESGVTAVPVEAEAVFEDLVALRCRLVEKYRGPADVPTEAARLRALVEDVAGGAPRVQVALTDDGAIVGFALFAEHGRTWHAVAVGYDYRDPRSRLTYFETAFYSAAERAYAEGITTLGYGQGSWQAKRARGCRATALTGWFHSAERDLLDAVRASAAATRLVE